MAIRGGFLRFLVTKEKIGDIKNIKKRKKTDFFSKDMILTKANLNVIIITSLKPKR